jgi:CubicO group peptidase (beta-lactamase class C family)
MYIPILRAGIFLVTILHLTVINGHGQDKTRQLKTLFDTLSRRNNFNGCVLITENGKELFQSPYGKADLGTNRNLQNGSMFELASVSKVFTALAIMQLKEKGLLSYEDSLRKFFPHLPYKGVTIGQLVAHTSGIEDFLTWTEEDINVNHINSNADIIKRLSGKKQDPAFKPGSRVRYSNSNYVLLASIVELVSQQPFASYLQKNIFAPANMQHTFVYNRHSKPLPENYAFDYSWHAGLGRFVRSDSLKRYAYYLAGVVGSYGVLSNTTDLYQFDQALSKNLLVSEETMKDAMNQSVTTSSAEGILIDPIPKAFAWQLLPGEGGDMFAAGSYGGFTSLIVRKISKKQTIILLSNFIETSEVVTIMTHIEDILEEGKLTFPEVKKMKNAIRLPAGQLQSFTGVYQKSGDSTDIVHIALINNLLYLKTRNAMEQYLFPESGTTFYSGGTEFKLAFEGNLDGKATSFKIVGREQEGVFKRVQ